MKLFKKIVYRILSSRTSLSSFVEGMILSYSLRKAKGEIGSDANRHLRARVLRHGIDGLREAIRSIGYTQGILLADGEVYALSDGIFLNMKGTNRYLKVIGDMEGNEGKRAFEFLKSKGIEVKKVIDLGANFGEISLYFSRRCPNAKILAVEASSDNFKILESNCRFQSFSTENITLLNEAVSDMRGVVEITKGVSAENIIMHPGIHRKKEDAAKPRAQTEKIASDTLVSFMNRFGFRECDFLKVDIEGSEPLLIGSFQECLSRIKAVLIEIGDKADHREYLPLIELLWKYGTCYDRESERNLSSLAEVTEEILSAPVADLWFLKRK